MNVMVQFPEGPRQVPALVMGRALLKPGETAAMLLVPRIVKGYSLFRRPTGGWRAVPS